MQLDDNGRVKVIDFGFARAHDQDSRPKTMCGTDDYMAPEVVSIIYKYYSDASYWCGCGSGQRGVLTNSSNRFWAWITMKKQIYSHMALYCLILSPEKNSLKKCQGKIQFELFYY